MTFSNLLKRFSDKSVSTNSDNIDRMYSSGIDGSFSPFAHQSHQPVNPFGGYYVPMHGDSSNQFSLKLGSGSGYAGSSGYSAPVGGGGGYGGYGSSYNPAGGHGSSYSPAGGDVGYGGGYAGGGSSYSPGGGYGMHRPAPVVWDTPRKGKNKGAALSALTLLAFLFFLNLLQSCLKEHMDGMNPTVMVMTAGSARQKQSDLAIERTFPEDSEFEIEGDDTAISNQTHVWTDRRENRSRTTIAPKLQNIFAKISEK